jgi:2-aminoadipate transaminase
VIDLSGASPRWPAAAREHWHDCLRRAAPADLDYRGDPLLREQIARRHGMPPEHVTVTAGVRAAALTYARREPLILLERPGFDGIGYALAGTKVERCSWAELFDSGPPPGAALWLTSPGRNPDGASLSRSDCERLASLTRSGHRVVVDGAYDWFAPDAPRVAGADLLGSLHKVAGRGTRLGWVCGERFFGEALPEVAGTTPPAAWQRAWGLFWAEGGLDVLTRTVVEESAAALAAFQDQLGHDLPYADGPNRLLPLAAGLDEPTALAALARRGFSLTAGVHFDVSRPALRATFTGVSAEQAAAFARVVHDRSIFPDPAEWTEG